MKTIDLIAFSIATDLLMGCLERHLCSLHKQIRSQESWDLWTQVCEWLPTSWAARDIGLFIASDHPLTL